METKEEPVVKIDLDIEMSELRSFDRILHLPKEYQLDALHKYQELHDLAFSDYHEMKQAIEQDRIYRVPKKRKTNENLYEKFCKEMEDLPSPSS